MEIAKDIVDNQVGEETVLLNLTNGRYFILNEVASLVWAGIKDSKSSETISSEISEQFSVEPDQAQSDLEVLLKDMQSNQIISI